jgi:hypothetical protein
MEEVSELLDILANTEVPHYFSLPYIQRFIDYQWDSPLRKAYGVVFGIQISLFVLILTSACFTNVENEELGDRVRLILSIANATLTSVAIGVFEVR